MTTIRTEIRISAPTQAVWDVLADFGGIEAFNPGVVASRSLTDANSGIGAERQCDFGSGTHIRERIVDWDDGHQFTLEIYQGKKAPPFKTAFSTFTVQADDIGTHVTAELQYGLKGGPFGWLMDRIVVSRKFEQAMIGVLAGLKRHVETGETVTAVTSLDIAAVFTAA